MNSYSDLMAQAQALMNQAEELRKQERAKAIAEIKAKMKDFGVTIADLGGSSAGRTGLAKSKSKSEPKYRGPNGELWSGGPGRKPDWVKAVLASGKDIEAFKI